MKDLWYIGNTSVRSALRLRDGIIALEKAPYLQGHIRGKDGDIAFRDLLGREGVVSLGSDSTNSVGRKWRAALCKLGFLYPDVSKSSGLSQDDLGPIDHITPNGYRLAHAKTVPAMQECFLRALSAQFIQYPIDKNNHSFFSPFLYVLKIMLQLEEQTGTSHISFLEMATIVQLSNPGIPISKTVHDIIVLRNRYDKASNKRLFASKLYKNAAAEIRKVDNTLRDYADANIRYLKASGVLQNKGRGIVFIPEKHFLVELLISKNALPSTALERYRLLCNGASLPTDEEIPARSLLNQSLLTLKSHCIPFDLDQYDLQTAAGIATAQRDIDDIILKEKEKLYAHMQREQWNEIIAYIDLLINKRKAPRETDIYIPPSEQAAYLEWIIWRAFLAINSLVNKPYDSRRFNVDQDFLPVSTAPGNGPDMIMEFSDYCLVVEVTLTESSRQEAAEGEPVRRHVASMSLQSNKPVLCLFIANHIDSNTAETFRNGVWFTKDDTKLLLNIIPLELGQFKSIFDALFSSGMVDYHVILKLLQRCRDRSNEDEAPGWKRIIEKEVSALVHNLSNAKSENKGNTSI